MALVSGITGPRPHTSSYQRKLALLYKTTCHSVINMQETAAMARAWWAAW